MEAEKGARKNEVRPVLSIDTPESLFMKGKGREDERGKSQPVGGDHQSWCFTEFDEYCGRRYAEDS